MSRLSNDFAALARVILDSPAPQIGAGELAAAPLYTPPELAAATAAVHALEEAPTSPDGNTVGQWNEETGMWEFPVADAPAADVAAENDGAVEVLDPTANTGIEAPNGEQSYFVDEKAAARAVISQLTFLDD